jgi:periplasmic divalent cation tolerance protein
LWGCDAQPRTTLSVTTTEAIVVLCTAPNEETAERLARALLDAHCVACVNILPGVRSIYRWQGAVEDSREVQLLIKTRRERFDEVKRVIRAVHPFDVPEIIALPVMAGSADYLAWIVAETS